LMVHVSHVVRWCDSTRMRKGLAGARKVVSRGRKTLVVFNPLREGVFC
jgi:hypothetical protein